MQQRRLFRLPSIDLPWAKILLALGVATALAAIGYSTYRHRATVAYVARTGADVAVDLSTAVFSHLVLPLAVLAIVAAIVYAGYVLVRHRRRLQREHREKVFDMVERICDLVEEAAETCPNEPYVSAPHIRDALIPLKDRCVPSILLDYSHFLFLQHAADDGHLERGR